MKIFVCLFQARRWMLWFPLLLAGALSDMDLADFAKILIGGFVLWIPYWLAWWLSNGFENISTWPGSDMLVSYTVCHYPWGDVYVDGD